ncbi:uncharacterized protein LOC113511250 isoform X2 [Galleria mellonella]|uniref:Uncharacterized protein LOC113511250 isoform X2 n=1 Tax=Galleria mellonella TaxID=7137 RepID=A0A6J1WJ69_GALME|nr:uncharacterized protein LOC113511250 isoform X2 [Galleria mellonella]
MKTKIQRILYMDMFFKVTQSTEHYVNYIYKKPSTILMTNIRINWLKYINTKTHKHLPVFINERTARKRNHQTIPFGILCHDHIRYNESTIVEHNLSDFAPNTQSKFNFKLIVPQEDVMQYFTQWQRYRKFWWSSIPNSSCLSCTMSLENALFVLLMDGLIGQNKTNYLRLHKNLAPYKISFALNCKDTKDKQTLEELSKLLSLKLQMNKVSTWVPDFSLSPESQIEKNLEMGVPYTAILNDSTLKNGIFQLMNSSTMLPEQVHVADFDSYASLLCNK